MNTRARGSARDLHHSLRSSSAHTARCEETRTAIASPASAAPDGAAIPTPPVPDASARRLLLAPKSIVLTRCQSLPEAGKMFNFQSILQFPVSVLLYPLSMSTRGPAWVGGQGGQTEAMG